MPMIRPARGRRTAPGGTCVWRANAVQVGPTFSIFLWRKRGRSLESASCFTAIFCHIYEKKRLSIPRALSALWLAKQPQFLLTLTGDTTSALSISVRLSPAIRKECSQKWMTNGFRAGLACPKGAELEKWLWPWQKEVHLVHSRGDANRV